MALRFAAALILSLAATAASAQAVPPAAAPAASGPLPSAAPPSAPVARPVTVRVSLQTTLGPIVLELEKERAPITTANFLRYVAARRFDGMTFYRATNIAAGYGLIQGGVRNDPKRVYPNIAHEPTTKTGLSHVDGAISMARAAPGTANGDFFITIGDLTAMDADPSKPGDNLGFAVFGRVVEGMDVVKRILAAPTSPTEGEGVMKGQMLAPPIRVLSARVAE